ncbi:hypothetical protein G7Y89_g12800 [Cudoniella acicularis]|uniref:CPAF-like PDZ domain-containing protein n=1 Tax=Cudoniella acicularis TaxID=354080 RepID=A0A8H4VZB0_9HELO|nr:hypothetical protein G7Y89_g12800 [Cudoniella acicularis]
MKLLFILSAVVLGVVGAVPSGERENATPASLCAIVSQSASAALSKAPGATPTVAAQLAYDCLASVPLNASAATVLVESILPYVEWQSDISYLKNPPDGYQEPGVDIWKAFDAILRNIKIRRYANEYQFQADLLRTFNSVHDGHFRFAPDLISKVFGFRRPVQLVSVSKDGVEIPKIYVRGDVANFTRNSTHPPSEIVKINGQDAEDFLEKLSEKGFLQDPDALYNNMFYELALDAQSDKSRYTGYFAGAGRAGYIYPGPKTTLEFENGTIRTYENYADVIGNFHGVTDGSSVYQVFCTGPKEFDALADNGDLPTRDISTAYGYPNAEAISSDKQIAGYFLGDDPTYADVAVLSVLSFEPTFPAEFQAIIQTFISDAKAAGKTKVVIDLSGNGGGIILNGYDAFRQFFPKTIQDGLTRFREHEAFNIMSRQLSNFSEGLSIDTASVDQVIASTSVLDYRSDLNQTNQKFLTFQDKFAPKEWNGDKFTSILRWNLTDPLFTTSVQWGLGMSITGYDDRQNFEQPFAPENIIMVYDGICASTCTIFSEFMRLNGGVKSIAMGGRPDRKPIQAIGGTKGTNNYSFGYILKLANITLGSATPKQKANWTAVSALTDLPLRRSTDTSINVRDNILNLKDGVPAQFLYEKADCRLFYEPEMLKDPKAIWKKAAAAAWGKGKCVAGSLPHKVETYAARRRKSEEMRIRAKKEKRRLVQERSFQTPQGVKTGRFGRKVPL